MTLILPSVTMVGWADLPDSDRSDFRCQCAIDISSLTNMWIWCKIEACPIHWFHLTYLFGHAVCNAISKLLSWCCLTHFCKWKKNILVTEQNPDSKSCYLVHNKNQPTAPIWPLVDDRRRLPRIPLLVESLWRVFFLGACPGNDKRYCKQLANNSITLVWGDYIFSSFAAASAVAKTFASYVQTLWANSYIFGTKNT